MRTSYTKDDLQTDIDWLIGQGVDDKEAEPFIRELIRASGGKIQD